MDQNNDGSPRHKLYEYYNQANIIHPSIIIKAFNNKKI
jgi:hypothetical protein